jgi:ribosomal protein L37E
MYMDKKDNKKEIFCRKCGVSSNDVIFQKNRRVCNPCVYKQSYERLKQKDYFKKYYENHRDEMVENALNHYYNVKKPKKNIVVEL